MFEERVKLNLSIHIMLDIHLLSNEHNKSLV